MVKSKNWDQLVTEARSKYHQEGEEIITEALKEMALDEIGDAVGYGAGERVLSFFINNTDHPHPQVTFDQAAIDRNVTDDKTTRFAENLAQKMAYQVAVNVVNNDSDGLTGRGGRRENAGAPSKTEASKLMIDKELFNEVKRVTGKPPRNFVEKATEEALNRIKNFRLSGEKIGFTDHLKVGVVISESSESLGTHFDASERAVESVRNHLDTETIIVDLKGSLTLLHIEEARSIHAEEITLKSKKPGGYWRPATEEEMEEVRAFEKEFC